MSMKVFMKLFLHTGIQLVREMLKAKERRDNKMRGGGGEMVLKDAKRIFSQQQKKKYVWREDIENRN